MNTGHTTAAIVKEKFLRDDCTAPIQYRLTGHIHIIFHIRSTQYISHIANVVGEHPHGHNFGNLKCAICPGGLNRRPSLSR